MQTATNAKELVITNAQVVTPHETFHGSVHVVDGQIEDVHPCQINISPAIDLEGDYLIPGLTDIHTDNLERHVKPRNNAEWPVLAALLAHDSQMASAGVTTIFDSLTVGMMGTGLRSFDVLKSTVAQLEIAKQQGMFRGDHLLHLRAEVSSQELPQMLSCLYQNSAVRLVSVMDHTPDQRQWRNLEKYTAMEKRDFHLTQEEIDAFLDRAQERHQKFSAPNRRYIVSLVEDLPIVLASHDDTTIEHVEEAHSEGIRISEFPTTVVAAETARKYGMQIVAGSPNLVLGRSHSGNVAAEELARNGLLDALASDYVPSSMLHGAFLLVERVGLPLHDAINMVSLAPSRMVGLHDRGSLAPGQRADMVRVRKIEHLSLPMMVWRQGQRVA